MICLICRRPACLFNLVDRETGWHGWCDFCNYKWRCHTTSTALNTSRLMDNTILRPHQRIIRQIVMSYIVVPVGTLRSIQQEAMHQVWRWLLLGRRCGNPMIIDSVSGILREADREDEHEDCGNCSFPGTATTYN